MIALGQLATQDVDMELMELAKLEGKVSEVLELMATDVNESHVQLLPAILCAYKQLNWQVPDYFYDKAVGVLEAHSDQLQFSSKVML